MNLILEMVLLLVSFVGFFLVLWQLKKQRSENLAEKLEQVLQLAAKTQLDQLRQDALMSRQEMQTLLSNTRNEINQSIDRLRQASTESMLKISDSISQNLKELQKNNEEKLEQMRLTVDEKLQKTLNTRLTESFESVTKHLLQVQRGLTEMQNLAQDVGGLKKALTNIKVRGILGEAQLKALLEQFLAQEQYAENVAVKPRSAERVEFAVKLPGVDQDETVWLPIDAKFPIEDYQRLQEAYDQGEKAAWEQAGKAFEDRLHKHAADIANKYIEAPHTTDFGLLFLPFESLYGEAIRRPGLFQAIQHKYRITLVGPTTLMAFLNSLQVGFKTMAISKQSSEVWKVLGAVKTEFKKFGDVVTKVQKNIETAASNLTVVSDRARQMEKKLKNVSELTGNDSTQLLALDALELSDDSAD